MIQTPQIVLIMLSSFLLLGCSESHIGKTSLINKDLTPVEEPSQELPEDPSRDEPTNTPVETARSFNLSSLRFSTPNNDLVTTSGEINITKSGAFLTNLVPTMRAYSSNSDGDVALLRFRYRGETEVVNKLASGAIRQQVGLKLRATDTCNVLYVVWQIYPKEQITIARKDNEGMTRHSECGATGYVNIKKYPVPESLTARSMTTRYLAAEIIDEERLELYLDNVLYDTIDLDSNTKKYLKRTRMGHSGLRTDNVDLIFKFMAH